MAGAPNTSSRHFRGQALRLALFCFVCGQAQSTRGAHPLALYPRTTPCTNTRRTLFVSNAVHHESRQHPNDATVTRHFVGPYKSVARGHRDGEDRLLRKQKRVCQLARGGGGGGAVAGPWAPFATWVGSSTSRCWSILILAISVEIGATTLIKMGSDASNAWLTIMAMFLYLVSLLCFSLSLPKIDVSVAYAVWSALGTASVAVAGITLFGEECTMRRILSILLILVGVVGLNLD